MGNVYKTAILILMILINLAIISLAEDIDRQHSDIITLQKILKQESCYDGEIDGLLGPKTKHAIKEFQKKSALKVSGEIDTVTYSKLLELNNNNKELSFKDKFKLNQKIKYSVSKKNISSKRLSNVGFYEIHVVDFNKNENILKYTSQFKSTNKHQYFPFSVSTTFPNTKTTLNLDKLEIVNYSITKNKSIIFESFIKKTNRKKLLLYDNKNNDNKSITKEFYELLNDAPILDLSGIILSITANLLKDNDKLNYYEQDLLRLSKIDYSGNILKLLYDKKEVYLFYLYRSEKRTVVDRIVLNRNKNEVIEFILSK